MDAFIARQPIFDRKGKVVAYELLYRDSFENYYSGDNGDKATCNVIANGFSLMGMDTITGGKKAFINFSQSMIEEDFITMLPNKVVVEILEDVEPTEDVLCKCKRLKENGYTLALDDFIFDYKYTELLNLTDIIKVDFMVTRYKKEYILKNVRNSNIKFLAEKVETKEDYDKARELGYDLFQGHFFSKPSIISSKDIPKEKVVYMKIFAELSSKNVNVARLESLVLKDLSISYKLLKIINSSMYGLKSKVVTLKQAITYLGERDFCKWLYVIVLGAISDEMSSEVVRMSLVRAKFCEGIGGKLYGAGGEREYKFFLVGMLSMLDVILERDMNSLLKELPVDEEVRNALLGGDNELRQALDLIMSYETADWDNIYKLSERFNMDAAGILEEYISALKWSTII